MSDQAVQLLMKHWPRAYLHDSNATLIVKREKLLQLLAPLENTSPVFFEPYSMVHKLLIFLKETAEELRAWAIDKDEDNYLAATEVEEDGESDLEGDAGHGPRPWGKSKQGRSTANIDGNGPYRVLHSAFVINTDRIIFGLNQAILRVGLPKNAEGFQQTGMWLKRNVRYIETFAELLDRFSHGDHEALEVQVKLSAHGMWLLDLVSATIDVAANERSVTVWWEGIVAAKEAFDRSQIPPPPIMPPPTPALRRSRRLRAPRSMPMDKKN